MAHAQGVDSESYFYEIIVIDTRATMIPRANGRTVDRFSERFNKTANLMGKHVLTTEIYLICVHFLEDVSLGNSHAIENA